MFNRAPASIPTQHKKRVTELHAESNRLRENERPLQQKLVHAEAELRSEEQRLDATVRDLDAAVSNCMRDHSKLDDYTRRLAQASSAHRQRELDDCEARFAEAEKQVAEKRTQLKERHHKKSVLNERLQGQEKLKLQMSANLKFRDLRIKERDLHAQAAKLQTELQGIEAVYKAADQEILRCQKVINLRTFLRTYLRTHLLMDRCQKVISQRGLERSRLEGSCVLLELEPSDRWALARWALAHGPSSPAAPCLCSLQTSLDQEPSSPAHAHRRHLLLLSQGP